LTTDVYRCEDRNKVGELRSDPGVIIDYTVGVTMKEKKTLELGRHLGIIAQLMTPGFQKCRSLTLSKHLFIRKLKKTILHGLSIPKPSKCAFLGK
jgi:hypothetical protein